MTKGAPSAKNGLESFSYFKAAVAEARVGKLQAIVTAPISKSSWALAGVPWKGHTDYLSRFYRGSYHGLLVGDPQSSPS